MRVLFTLVFLLLELIASNTALGKIAFSSDRDGNWEIYVIDDYGGNPRNLTRNPADDRHPSWSPDGKRIVFQSNREDGRNWQLYIMNADGSNPHPLTTNLFRPFKEHKQPSWHPDGGRIALISHDSPGWNVYVMDIESKELKRLTNLEPDDAYNPRWSPDGKRIVFERGIGGVGIEIWMLDIESGDLTRLTKIPANTHMLYLRPVWSPKGDRILYFKEAFGTTSLMMMDEKGEKHWKIIEDVMPGCSWSPSGDRIVYTDFNGDLCLFDLNRKKKIGIIAAPGLNIEPDWWRGYTAVKPLNLLNTLWSLIKTKGVGLR